ncbi:CSEP0032 putative effector protein [Blumeria hordei DH14]|uniref:CSEP0032 putative effector protein n=1 Tax=Blumeria graminis f. sp. hordei (strain DH14) TaxID=546991 RepID=N1JES2_BLUG1|nr:CSEP0032 putative effector protein [Blumeria hordei DH14]
MRFSNIATIFQCVALFVPTLAVYKFPHTNEGAKSFNCYNKIIYASQYWEEKLFADSLAQQGQKIIVQAQDVYNAFLSTTESNLVLYDDNNASYFYEHKLITVCEIQGRMVQIQYSLLIDNYGRVCAIFMHEQLVGVAGSSFMHEVIPRNTKSFCTINS